MKRLKVLISAYACEPEKGSEPEVGWNWVKHIAQFADVWVITRTNNRKSIEKVLARESMSNVHWIYFDLPRWLCFWKKGQRGVHLYYYLWQVGICFLVRRLHQKVGFDLIHHVTFGNYWLPSFLPLLSVPFIWGPVGGGESAPKAFYAVYSTNAKFRELLRDLARFISDYNPIHRFIAKKVSVALATTEQTADRIKKRLGIKRVYVMPQFAMSREKLIYLEEISSSTVSEKTGSVIFISVGRNLGYKGFHLGLMAFRKLVEKYENCEYWITNTGPEHQYLKNLARKLSISDKVRFLGKLNSLQDVYQTIAKSDVLVHPALHEAFGNAVLEGMALRKPVICLDLGGPALQVTEETGFKIPVRAPEQVIEDMAQAMFRLVRDEGLRHRMGEAGRRRVIEKFTWKHRVEQIRQIYANLLHE